LTFAESAAASAPEALAFTGATAGTGAKTFAASLACGAAAAVPAGHVLLTFAESAAASAPEALAFTRTAAGTGAKTFTASLACGAAAAVPAGHVFLTFAEGAAASAPEALAFTRAAAVTGAKIFAVSLVRGAAAAQLGTVILGGHRTCFGSFRRSRSLGTGLDILEHVVGVSGRAIALSNHRQRSQSKHRGKG